MKVVNLTEHQIVVVGDDAPAVMDFETAKEKAVAIYPPSGEVARVKPTSVRAMKLTGFPHPVFETYYGRVEGLPPAEHGVVYIVASLVRVALEKAMRDRMDVMAPDTFPPSVVKDEDGRIVAVKRFKR